MRRKRVQPGAPSLRTMPKDSQEAKARQELYKWVTPRNPRSTLLTNTSLPQKAQYWNQFVGPESMFTVGTA